MKIHHWALAALLLCTVSSFSQAKGMEVYDLRCEYLVNPLGIDAAHPRFTWKVKSSDAAIFQQSRTVYVDTDSLRVSQGKAEMWFAKAGKENIVPVVYAGKPLKPFTRYFWKVVLRDNKGNTISSPVTYFETGLMERGNWRGHWISDSRDRQTKPAPHFRKTFEVKKAVRSARAYIAVAGLYELSINGKRVGASILDPAYTRFDRRVLYVTHDITGHLADGGNAVGVLLGNGWYNHQSTAVWNFHVAPWRDRPAFCMDIRITYEDGTVEYVSTGRDWKTRTGPVIFNSIYTGEHYDASLEMPGWDRPGYTDTAWRNASYRAAPAPLITAQSMHPVRVIETYKPSEINQIGDSLYVLKFPINLSGVVRITAGGDSGTVIRLKHGERVDTNGRVDLSNLDVHYRPTDDLDPFQTDIFILSGKGKETFQPRFNYKGFQYVEISWSKPVQFEQTIAEAVRMHSDVPGIGNISTRQGILEPLFRATNNSYLSNLFGYPTDCPQREKNGWTGDAHIAQETGLYSFDAITVYEKWLADHRDEQQPNGVLPSIIPTGGWGYDWGNGPDWTSTIAIIPWNLYLFYGDDRALRDNYEPLKRYVDYINQQYPSGITSWGLGDWIPVKSQTPVPFTSTAYYYKDVTILAKAAQLFGRKEDHQHYTELADKISTAFNQQFFDSARVVYGSGLQTELSVALHFGLVPDHYRRAVADQLAERVLKDSVKLDVGLLGTKSILNALSENGHADLAYRLATRDSFPSWGWWIKNGATSLYENWPIDAQSDISMNHIMFGEIGAWMYKGLAGIYPDPEKPGFRHFFLRPFIPPDLPEFTASHTTPYGEISSGWYRENNLLRYHAGVPVHSAATLSLAIPEGTGLYTNGKHLKTGPGIYHQLLPAGNHSFEIR